MEGEETSTDETRMAAEAAKEESGARLLRWGMELVLERDELHVVMWSLVPAW